MAILRVTKKAILEVCQKSGQMDFNMTFLQCLEHLNAEKRTQQDKSEWAESLVNSFKVNED
jgi:hypothetical protein